VAADSIFSTSPPRAAMPGGSNASSPMHAHRSPATQQCQSGLCECRTNGFQPTRRRSVLDEFSAFATAGADSRQNKSLLYRLAAVVVHDGNATGGHYRVYRRLLTPLLDGAKAYAKFVDNMQRSISSSSTAPPPLPLPSSKWVHISDQAVRPASLDEVLQAQAYLLYYEKMQQ
jgi:hypothetical protein